MPATDNTTANDEFKKLMTSKMEELNLMMKAFLAEESRKKETTPVQNPLQPVLPVLRTTRNRSKGSFLSMTKRAEYRKFPLFLVILKKEEIYMITHILLCVTTIGMNHPKSWSENTLILTWLTHISQDFARMLSVMR